MTTERTLAGLALAALALCACATTPPGDDDKGKELKAQATPVLVALVKYRKDHGAYPSSLYELVPKYLQDIPFGPNFNFVREKNLLRFDYAPSWPRSGNVACAAQLGSTEWLCQDYE